MLSCYLFFGSNTGVLSLKTARVEMTLVFDMQSNS